MICAALVALTLTQAPVLTFQEALAQAEAQNLDLQVAQARLGQARLVLSRVRANYLPQLSVGGSYTRNSVEAEITLPTGYFVRNVGQPQGPQFDPTQEVSPENPPGAPSPYILFPSGFAEAVIQPLNQLGGQAQLTQALLAPALWPAMRAARLGAEVAQLSVENARRQILFGAAQLYYGAAALGEAVKAQQRLLETNLAHEKDAKLRFEAGTLPRVAVLRAEIDRVRSEQDLRRAQNSLASTKSSLAALLARDPDFEVTMPPEPELPEALLAPTPPPLDERPDLAAARASVELAEVQRRGVYYQYLPNIGLTGTYRLANAGGFTGRNDSWAIGVGANWILWDGGAREVALRENALKVVENRATLRSTELKAADELRRAQLDLQSALANRIKAAEQLSLARENMKLVNVSYEAGAATYLEVTDATSALTNAEINAVAEGLNASLAKLRVIQAAGLFAVP